MRDRRGFDEVMIVNPSTPGSGSSEGVIRMRFHYAPQVGYPGTYGYYGEDPYGNAGIGHYGEPPDMSGWGAAEPVGYYTQEQPMGWYAEDPSMAYYGDDPSVAYYGDDQSMAYYGEDPSVAYYGDDPSVAYYGDD